MNFSGNLRKKWHFFKLIRCQLHNFVWLSLRNEKKRIEKQKKEFSIPRTAPNWPPRRKWLPAKPSKYTCKQKRVSISQGSSVHVRIDVGLKVERSTILSFHLSPFLSFYLFRWTSRAKAPAVGLPGITKCSKRNSVQRKQARRKKRSQNVMVYRLRYIVLYGLWRALDCCSLVTGWPRTVQFLLSTSKKQFSPKIFKTYLPINSSNYYCQNSDGHSILKRQRFDFPTTINNSLPLRRKKNEKK